MGNNTTQSDQVILKDSIFRIGKVFSVEGRQVKISVDKQKNASHLLYKGELLKNVSVGGYIKVIKGFTSIIAKVESEQVKEDLSFDGRYNKEENKINRILNVKLLGFIQSNKFERGIKELPLIDNECFLLDKDEIEQVHDFVKKDDVPLRLGSLAEESGQPIKIGVNGLFASHVGVFGNTGSGKSYTLAKLYRTLFEEFRNDDKFRKNARFLLFDFNGEYNLDDTIITDKNVINLSTKTQEGKEKLIFNESDLLDIELFSIMSNASEKTQRPFLSRTLNFYSTVSNSDNPLGFFKNMLRKRISDVLKMSDKVRAFLLLDYLKAVLPPAYDMNGIEIDLAEELDYHNNSNEFIWNGFYLRQNPNQIMNTALYKQVDEYTFSDNFISRIIDFLYLQLIYDVISNRAQNEHISPAINKLKSFQRDIGKVLEIKKDGQSDFWNGNYFSVINLNEANINMKKLIPLLVSFKLYSEHKKKKIDQTEHSLNIIIDEAHNILSYSSQRESENWKDYRLETFEEIIKEGRKFGVFLTIASQRPSDISSTIISQLHNYFLHRLINNKDIDAIERTISYLDKVSFDSLPLLPTGVCILAGLMAQVPVVVKIDEMEKKHEPNNKTIDLVNNWRDKVQ
ncbi:ATP-binding protein [Flagellimonas alvinocaridis]|uniref:ATP-binding protein n=1 Tax=Flagellimonas alvinocaridis TaxID=2530200 RepID=A0A4S8RI38_9FLAO|nr:ATP-binding protein [Allomuricauda alvinocaridis]THV58053.1 ATP-binding protein [Allomuricauda alvinocaridis]